MAVVEHQCVKTWACFLKKEGLSQQPFSHPPSLFPAALQEGGREDSVPIIINSGNLRQTEAEIPGEVQPTRM